jgi:osmoprotectant transport system substrate-binding protein
MRPVAAERPRARARRWAVALPLVLLAGCTSHPSAPGPGNEGGAITIASFNFPESELLAQIYGQALARKGYPVRLVLDAGPRELVEPALMKGLVQLVPEYAGSALAFLTLNRQPGSSDEGATHDALVREFARRGILALSQSPAQDANGIAVSAATAERYGLQTISNLKGVAGLLRFGGPPECPQRPYCLLGLERTYGLHFQDFYGLDTGGPLTVGALQSGEIDVGLLFTTNPVFSEHRLVLLVDDGDLQPAENVTPVIRQDVVERYGSGLVAVISMVSSLLTTDGLRALNRRVEVEGISTARVALEWLIAEGLG